MRASQPSLEPVKFFLDSKDGLELWLQYPFPYWTLGKLREYTEVLVSPDGHLCPLQERRSAAWRAGRQDRKTIQS